MSEFATYAHQGLRYSHIACGFTGLVLFWVPVVVSKGGRVHRFTGMCFAIIALWVGSTGFIASMWAIANPVSYAGSLGQTFSEKATPFVIERTRFFFSLLSFLSIGTVSGVVLGVACAWTKSRHEDLCNFVVVGSLVATLFVALGLAAFGGWNLWLGQRGEHLLSTNATRKYSVSLILGLIGSLGTWSDLRYVFAPAKSKMEWFYQHMQCMLGAGIAFYTAFLVFGANRIYERLGISLPGMWSLIPWLAPSAIGIPLIYLWVAKYRRKFERTNTRVTDVNSPATHFKPDMKL